MWANLSLGQAIKFAIYFAWWNLKPLPNLLDLYPKKNYLFLIRHHFKRSLSLISLYLKELKVLFLFLVNSKILEGYYLLFYFSFSSLSCTNYFYFVSQKKKKTIFIFSAQKIFYFSYYLILLLFQCKSHGHGYFHTDLPILQLARVSRPRFHIPKTLFFSQLINTFK